MPSTLPCPNILVLGDFMLDRYTHGAVLRASPEAPVVVLDVEREEARLGGAGAVAILLAGLGVRPIVAGVIGDDAAGGLVTELVGRVTSRSDPASFGMLPDKETRRYGDKASLRGDVSPSPCDLKSLAGAGVSRGQLHDAALLQAPGRPTTVKERLIGSAGRHPQQLLRVDRESRQPLSGELEDKLLAAAILAVDDAKAVLISDYGKGVCTSKIMQTVIAEARKRRLPVLVDPRRGADYSLYRFANVIKPNRHEANEALGRAIRTRAEAFVAGRELCRRWNFQAAVITLDADGLVLVTADGTEARFAAAARQVFDVTGAGDTVLAMLAAALVRGMTLSEACRLAVYAAGLQVERFGVSPLSWHEVAEDGLPSPSSAFSVGNAVRAVPPAPLPLPPDPQAGAPCRGEGGLQSPAFATPSPCPLVSLFPCQPISIDVLINQLARHRRRGETIIFTNGCFDLFHAGHLHCLTAAKALGDVLIVALNSDFSVRRLKGDSRPIVCQRDRGALIAALACVDYVTLFDDDTPERLIAKLRPDVLVKGAESYPDGIPGEGIVRSYGGRIELIPLLPGHSTTALSLFLRERAGVRECGGRTDCNLQIAN